MFRGIAQGIAIDRAAVAGQEIKIRFGHGVDA
jgi:hypothetical protein